MIGHTQYIGRSAEQGTVGLEGEEKPKQAKAMEALGSLEPTICSSDAAHHFLGGGAASTIAK